MDIRKQNLIATLRAFARQRPGLEFGNYGDIRAYRAESRDILKHLHHAEEMLGAVSWRDSIGADELIRATPSRLTITESAPGEFRLDYCAGQYWPTEYRRAVCSLLSSALWDYWRTNGAQTGDDIRKKARAELSRSVSSAWFR